ncbi:transposase [Bifidobacterium pseudolongum subsp. globosum]|uniref:Mutator family transposase n=4 Tax=Bifidobacterium pseudolongum subsp. globosum TaxID=1690 RepID=A0A2N3QDW1_9BIFI|nr:IS256 family transposase [Bifidobacterium pseudolongum]PKU88173.1 transposase [Bifidobacterium pseudolongum subsp. globosum]
MTSVTDDVALTMDDMPLGEDGLIDFRALAVGLIETVVNHAMELEADELLGEGNRRNGYRERRLRTVIGEIVLRVPKLREDTYFPERVMRPYSRVDRAMVGVVSRAYVNGMSTRRIEKVAGELEFGRLSPSTVSRMLSSLDGEVDALRQAEFDMPVPYLWLDATYVKCRDDDSRVCSKATVTAIGAFMDGTRRFVGFDLVDTESYDSWKRFLLSLRRRGVSGVRLVTSDAHAGLRRAVMEVFDGASWQRCFVHLQRDLAARIRHKPDRGRAMRALSAVLRQGDEAMTRAAYDAAVDRIGALDRRAGELLEDAREDALAHLAFHREHWVRLRTNNVQERANAEIKRRTRAVQIFPSRESLIRLVGAVLVDMNETWTRHRFMSADDMATALEPRAREHVEISDELRQRADQIIMTALESAA